MQYGIIETMHEIILKRRKLLTVSNDDVDRLNKKRTKNWYSDMARKRSLIILTRPVLV